MLGRKRVSASGSAGTKDSDREGLPDDDRKPRSRLREYDMQSVFDCAV